MFVRVNKPKYIFIYILYCYTLVCCVLNVTNQSIAKKKKSRQNLPSDQPKKIKIKPKSINQD